jgi:hypothetical protein
VFISVTDSAFAACIFWRSSAKSSYLSRLVLARKGRGLMSKFGFVLMNLAGSLLLNCPR